MTFCHSEKTHPSLEQRQNTDNDLNRDSPFQSGWRDDSEFPILTNLKRCSTRGIREYLDYGTRFTQGRHVSQSTEGLVTKSIRTFRYPEVLVNLFLLNPSRCITNIEKLREGLLDLITHSCLFRLRVFRSGIPGLGPSG